jgi:hypothetical protein
LLTIDSKQSPESLQNVISNPIYKHIRSNEEVIPILSLKADSTYTSDLIKSDESKFSINNIITNESFWSSSGNHNPNEIITVLLSFEKTYRITGIWIHWALAPGEFNILISNDNINYTNLFKEGFRSSKKDCDIDCWKNLLQKDNINILRSFDERIDIDVPIFVQYIQIKLRIPIFSYFGIYKIEAYYLSKSVAMLKNNNNLCLTVLNANPQIGSLLVAIPCTDTVAYSDNRDLFIISSNGFITAFTSNLCIEINDSIINLEDCSISQEYMDNRNQWQFDHLGYIRPLKALDKCFSNTGSAYLDISKHANIVSSSTQNIAKVENILDYSSTNTYWASEATIEDVILIIELKVSTMLKSVVINWQFSAKTFYVYGKLLDDYWKLILSFDNNKQQTNEIFLNGNTDFKAIKITMKESNIKLEDSNIYGIKNIYLNLPGNLMTIDECLMESSQWEIIDIYFTEEFGKQNLQALTEFNKAKDSVNKITGKFSSMPFDLTNIENEGKLIKSKIAKLNESLNLINQKLNNFYDFAYNENSSEFFIGSDPKHPASECSEIIKASPGKRNGFYWIKTECMKNPLKLYCDFQSGQNFYLAVNNNLGLERPSYLSLYNTCTELGLGPVEIRSLSDLKTINKLLKQRNDLATSNAIIPIAIDYSCPTCNREFKSLNSKDNKNITDLLKQFDVQFDVLYVNTHDIVGFTGDSFKLKTERLSEVSIPIFVCSSNNFENNSQYFELTCEDTFHVGVIKGTVKSDTFTVKCPRDCLTTNTKVYGTDIYSSNSPTCKSAIHAGLILNKGGGLVEVEKSGGNIQEFKGSERNGINSYYYNNFENVSGFSFHKYIPKCNYISFIEMEQDEVDLNDAMMDEVLKYLNQTELRKQTSKLDFKDLSKFVETNNNSNIRKNIFDYTTETALNELNHKTNAELKNLKQLKIVSDNLGSILDNISNRVENLFANKKEGIDLMNQDLKAFNFRLLGLNRNIKLLDKLIALKVAKSEFDLIDLKHKMAKLAINDNFIEDFKYNNINLNYEVYNPADNKIQSQWEYFKINNNETAVIQSTNHNLGNYSHLVIKNRDFYDFEFNCKVLIPLVNSFGIGFRYRDAFNHYIFEIKPGGKSLSRIVNGQITQILNKDDGGHMKDTWIMIRIVTEAAYIKIFTNDYGKFDLVFEAYDYEFLHGTIAFITTGKVFISDIIVKNTNCKDITDKEILSDIITNTCNNYREDYKLDNWKSVQVGNIENSYEWAVEENIDGRLKLISQKNIINTSNDSEEGSLFILQNKHCNEGKLSVKLKSLDSQGVIGIIFKYMDEDNYYLAEISATLTRIRKKINGNFYLLKINQDYKYRPGEWYKAELVIKESQFMLYLTIFMENVNKELILTSEDFGIRNGMTGLYTYHTRAYFDEFELNPSNTEEHEL